MKLSIHNPDRRSKVMLLYAASYLLPLFIQLIAVIGMGIAPFGEHTLVISDANGYYINTLAYAGRMYRGLEGLLYSFEKTIGGNMIGHLNGILLTPFAFLLSFSDITAYPSVYTFISILSLSLGGLSMYLFLADAYGHGRSRLIFSTSYALMGFNTANVFQAVFFWAAPLLPLMALGLKRLMQGKSPLLYIFSLAFGLFTNSYFGFVLCAASVLFFFTELFTGDWSGRRLRIFGHYAISSLLGGLSAAVLWLPSFLSLSGGRLDQTQLTDFTFNERMPLLEFGAKLFSGAISTSELVYGRPNIFVGLLPVFLTVLFFLNGQTEKRKKTAAGILLGVFLLCFYIKAFDMVMHGGTSPNWFNFRYSYVFSFLLLVIAAEMWERLESVPGGEYRRCLGILTVAAVLIFSRSYEFVSGGSVVLDFALLVLIGLGYWMYRRNPAQNPRSSFELVALLLVCVSLFLNYRLSVRSIREWEHKADDFRNTVVEVDPLVQGTKISDSGFYRMEINRQRSGITGNDPMLYGYNGVGHGGSNERDFVRVGLFKLGIPWYSNRSYYADGVPAATDALLGVKYVIAEEDLSEEKGYERRVKLGKWGLYQNPDALPIAVLASRSETEQEFDFTSVFENLNTVWTAISGVDTPVFVEEDAIVFRSHNMADPMELTAERAREAMASLDEQAENSARDGESAKESGSPKQERKTEIPEDCSYIEYSFTAKQDGPIYVYERNGVTDAGASPLPAISWLGNYKAGDTVIGYIRANVTEFSRPVMEELSGRFRAAYADPEALHTLSGLVQSRPITVEKERESRLTGEYTAEEGQCILFTIPWDEGWTLTVDGQETELKKAFGLFMSAEVESGMHSYEMKFVPTGLYTGLTISVCALAFTIIYLLIDRKRRRITPGQEADYGDDGSEGEKPDESLASSDVCVSDVTQLNKQECDIIVSEQAKNPAGRLCGLDFVKIIATLFIVLHHYQQAHQVYFENGINFYYGKFYFGWLVELFFVISGFVMLPYVERIKNGLDFKKYFGGRYFRFQPLMAISVGACAFLLYLFKIMYLRPWDNNYGVLDFIISAIGLHAFWNKVFINNPMWYISVLLVCYAVMYGIVRLCKKLSIHIWIGFVLAVLIGVCIFSNGINVFLLNSRTARGLYAFFWGLLLAEAVQQRRPNRFAYIAAVFVLLVTPLLYIFAFKYDVPQINYVLTFVVYTAIILVFTSKLMTKIFNGKMWSVVSGISYNAYVWHSVVYILAAVCFYLVRAVPDFSKKETIVCMVVSVYAVSALSYFFIDKPFQRWIRNIGKK